MHPNLHEIACNRVQCIRTGDLTQTICLLTHYFI